MRLNKKGFTLIELLAVIVLTSLVLGLSSYGIISAYNKSKEKAMVLNESSILEAARISSSEASPNEWKTLENREYFCTTIQRLKNVGLLKKEAKSEEHEDFSLITVERDTTTLNVVDTNFVEDDNRTLIELCDIKYFTIHYDYNVPDTNGMVPNNQSGEVCNATICEGISISSIKPKREGYRFTGWNTESSGSGFSYHEGDIYSSYSEGTITLYAQWEEDTYVIKYDANIDNATGSTSKTICTRNNPCTLTENGFSKSGYEFVGWNTERDKTGTTYQDEEAVMNITSSDKITLYAMWKAKYKVIVKFNTGGGNITSSTTSSTGTNYRWTKDANGIISRSTDNGSTYSDTFFTIDYNSENDLPDYNNSRYMYITKTGYGVSSGSVWKCTEGCTVSGSTFDQTHNYNSNAFCDAISSNCTVVLTVNWENQSLLSPIITPSDGIQSGQCHGSNYNLSITSENTGSVTYQYKIGTGSYKTYSSPLSPAEGETTYTARTKNGTRYSGTVSYVSKLDKTPPSVPTIDNPTGGNWTNESFALTLHSTDALCGIAYYQYKYASDSNWTTYPNSASETFTTTDFSLERNEKVYIRACDVVGNCSNSAETYIRIDKTAPEITFAMKNNNAIIEPISNEYSLIESSEPKWINYVPTLEWTIAESGSGIAEKTISYNRWGLSTLSKEIVATNDLSNPLTVQITADGYRYINYRVCDNVNNCSESKVYIKLDFTNPTFTFNMKKDSSAGTTVSASSNEYSLTQSNNLKWINYIPYLEWTTSDTLSGIKVSLNNNFSYNNVNLSTLSTNIVGRLSVAGDSNGVFGTAIGSDGYRYFKFEICDIAGNCVNSDVYVKLDKQDPNLSFQMFDGNTAVSSNNYSSSASNSLKWFTFVPTLRWTASDTLSDINTSANYNYNAPESETINETLPNGNVQNVTGTKSGNNYIFSVGNISGGYRKIKMNVCDNAGNCVSDIEYFKYYANSSVMLIHQVEHIVVLARLQVVQQKYYIVVEHT